MRPPRSLPGCSASRRAMDAEMFEPLRPRRAKKSRSEPVEPETAPNPADSAAATERAETILWVRGQIADSALLAGTPGERYLIENRGLKGPVWPASLRWAERYRLWPDASPRSCLLATVTNPSGEIVAVHSIEIDPATGGKSCGDHPKMSRGPISAASSACRDLGRHEQPQRNATPGAGVRKAGTSGLCRDRAGHARPQG